MTNEIKKITKKEMFKELLVMVKGEGTLSEEITNEMLAEFIEKEIKSLDKKADAAREKREGEKAKSDELAEQVYNCLNNKDFTTIAAIVKCINDEDVTQNKVSARLAAMVREGKVEKDQVKVSAEGEKTRKVNGYRIIG